MTIQQFIFSDARAVKIRRHLLFWIMLGLGYFVQSILITPHPLLVASCSLVVFFPTCILASYTCIYFLLPRFYRRKMYFVLGLEYLVLLFICFALNYLLSMLLYRLTNFHPIRGFRFSWYFSLAFINTMHLGAITGLSLGIGFTKTWYMGQKENLLLFQENTRKEVRLQKSRAYPEVVKKSLATLSNNLRSGANDSPELLIAISDVFSYLLYSTDEGEIEVKKEICLLKKIAFLENSIPDNPFLISIGVTGEVDSDLMIPSMALYSILQCAIALLHEQKEFANEFQLDVTISDNSLITTAAFFSAGDPENGQINWNQLLVRKVRSARIVAAQIYKFIGTKEDTLQILISGNPKVAFSESSESKVLILWQ